MKRAAVILIIGLAGAVAAYCALYFHGTSKHREILESPTPELAWLKDEFHVSDAEFKRISDLHDGYLPHCKEMCRRIDKKNNELKELLAKTNVLTSEIEQKLIESSQLRIECQKQMLQHFLDVSRQMPPEQGRRYLAWVQERTFLPRYGMIEQR
jgi:hypothetical protein